MKRQTSQDAALVSGSFAGYVGVSQAPGSRHPSILLFLGSPLSRGLLIISVLASDSSKAGSLTLRVQGSSVKTRKTMVMGEAFEVAC